MPKKLPSPQPAIDAYEEVEEARTAFFDAVSAWCEGLDLTPLHHAFATWQKAIETYNETVSALAAAYGESLNLSQFVEDQNGLYTSQIGPAGAFAQECTAMHNTLSDNKLYGHGKASHYCISDLTVL